MIFLNNYYIIYHYIYVFLRVSSALEMDDVISTDQRAKVWDYVDSELAHISFRKLHFVLKSHVSLTADLCNERYARCIVCSSHVLNIMVQAGLKVSNIMNLFMVFYKSLFQKYWENPNIVSISTQLGAQKVLEEILPRRFFGYSCDAAGRILGKNRTSLSPETLEALKVNYHIKFHIIATCCMW
ncbi:hypothetical protein ACJX0J_012581, partial [Zea mays]